MSGDNGSERKKLLVVLGLLVIVVLGLLFYQNNSAFNFGNSAAESKSQTKSDNSSSSVIGSLNIAEMVSVVSPAVVNIEVKIARQSTGDYPYNDPFFRQFFGDNMLRPREYTESGIGSGFIISEDGYVVTNQHVIENAAEITVNSSNKKYKATVVGQDSEMDLAVLKIDSPSTFSTLKLGNSDQSRVGDWVIAIGNPYGLDHTVTVGVVSAKGRPMTIDERQYKNLIQTDAAINPGNSGGPLLNPAGEVIGINTAVNAEAQGIGFAISINTAKKALDELISKGKITRAYIGVYLQPVDDELASYFGVPAQGIMAASIIPGGPAEQAGLHKYDIIISIDKNKLETYEQLHDYLEKKQPGQSVVLEVRRDGQIMEIPVILSEKPQ
jgi:serine protease Do